MGWNDLMWKGKTWIHCEMWSSVLEHRCCEKSLYKLFTTILCVFYEIIWNLVGTVMRSDYHDLIKLESNLKICTYISYMIFSAGIYIRFAELTKIFKQSINKPQHSIRSSSTAIHVINPLLNICHKYLVTSDWF